MPDLPIASAATLNHTTIASGDLFPVLDISAASGSKGSKITFGELFNGVPLLGVSNVFNPASGSAFSFQVGGVAKLVHNASTDIIEFTNANVVGDMCKFTTPNGSIAMNMGGGGLLFVNAPVYADSFLSIISPGNSSIQAKLFNDTSSNLHFQNGYFTGNAVSFYIYEKRTDASNYARLSFITTAGSYSIKPEAAGTGTLRTLNISGLPTSASGLPSGTLWNNLGIVNVA